MRSALQSSYKDVEYEMRAMTREHKDDTFLFMAGDGLALMRLNHILAANADTYIFQTPVVIPIQGEHPHGLFHAMHCQWRLHRQFIMWCATKLENGQILEEPNVSVFNVHRFFFLHVLTRACAKYVLRISETPNADDLDDPVPFIAKAEANVNFAWVVHFLHDAGFFILDFLQSVRGNDSRKLDLLWREFFSAAHTGTANKTQYVQMAIMRVFWGQALVPALNDLYHSIRTIPSGTHDGCGVGWDWAVEMLNAAIKAHVAHHVSEAQIRDFVANWALLEAVQDKLRTLRHRNWSANPATHGFIPDADVNKLVKLFCDTIGDTWAKATAPNSVSHVTQGPQRAQVPWAEVRATQRARGEEAVHRFVGRHISKLTSFFPWAD